MKQVKIINGIYGYKPAGSKFIVPVTAGDPPITLVDEEAQRLVSIGIAMYISETDSVLETKNAKPEFGVDMKAEELRELMKTYGLSCKTGMPKADMVDKLNKFFANECEDDNEIPSISEEDIVL